MNDKILLTISILISDRPDTVEKCLQSLDSLRKNVSCELILTDTGCGDKVRAIIERYADVILEFEWCRDFAKARNLGLDAARGEWFLYLDDDEWFEDTKEIEEFFVTGLYKEYGGALYLQRNYTNMKGSIYTDSPVSRMTCLGKGVRFQYSIHETFQNYRGPHKLLHSYVHHYGYIFKNRYDKYMHSQRNLVPLLEEHERAPYILRHNAQLAQEYNGIGEYTKSIEISLKGIEDYREGESGKGNLNSLFVNVVERYLRMCRYEEAISYAERYIADERINRLGMARISMLIMEALYELKEYQKCEKYCDIYLKIYTDYSRNKEGYLLQTGLFLDNSFDDRHKAISLGVATMLKLKKYTKAKKLFDEIDLDSNVLVLDVELLKSIIDAFVVEKLTEIHPCVFMLNKLFEREQLHPKIIECFEEIRNMNPNMIRENVCKWEYLKENCWYITYLRLNNEKIKREELVVQFQKLWHETEKILPQSLKLGIWEVAEKEYIEMGKVIRGIPYYKWENAVRYTNLILDNGDLREINEYICRFCDKETRYRNSWELYYAKKQLEQIDEDEQEQTVIAQLTKFSGAAILLAKEIYKMEILNHNKELLPVEIQVAFCILDIDECLEKRDFLQSIRLLKDVKNLLPTFAIPVKVYIKFIERQLKQQEQELQTNRAEMEQLESTIKERIQNFVQVGDFTTALQLILQLESIIGKDIELDEWKERCINC